MSFSDVVSLRMENILHSMLPFLHLLQGCPPEHFDLLLRQFSHLYHIFVSMLASSGILIANIINQNKGKHTLLGSFFVHLMELSLLP